MELNHTFKKPELTTDDSNFQPFTGELPSRLQMFAERALARYEKMSPVLREHFKSVMVSTNAAALRTAHVLDTKRPIEVGANDDQYDVSDSKADFLRPKYAA
jgi:hypothetical protein